MQSANSGRATDNKKTNRKTVRSFLSGLFFLAAFGLVVFILLVLFKVGQNLHDEVNQNLDIDDIIHSDASFVLRNMI